VAEEEISPQTRLTIPSFTKLHREHLN